MTANITPDGKFAYYSHKGIQIIDLGGFIPTIFGIYNKKVYYMKDDILYVTKPPYTKQKISNHLNWTNHDNVYINFDHINIKPTYIDIDIYDCQIFLPENSTLIYETDMIRNDNILIIYLLDDVVYYKFESVYKDAHIEWFMIIKDI